MRKVELWQRWWHLISESGLWFLDPALAFSQCSLSWISHNGRSLYVKLCDKRVSTGDKVQLGGMGGVKFCQRKGQGILSHTMANILLSCILSLSFFLSVHDQNWTSLKPRDFSTDRNNFSMPSLYGLPIGHYDKSDNPLLAWLSAVALILKYIWGCKPQSSPFWSTELFFPSLAVVCVRSELLYDMRL